jgi:hypothetical protein
LESTSVPAPESSSLLMLCIGMLGAVGLLLKKQMA